MNQFENGNPSEGKNGESLAEFESHLTRALHRVDAPQGFADRVMTQARSSPAPRVLTMKQRQQAWLSGAIAATLLVGVFGAGQIHLRRQRERAALAQQQFEAGIRITDDALDHALDQLQQAGIAVSR